MGFVYRVEATLPSPDVRAEYLAWLLDEGHAAAVVAAGAESAEVVELEPEADGALRVATRYVFRDRAAYQRYVAGPAAALRADGVARFVEPYGITFTRRLGQLRG